MLAQNSCQCSVFECMIVSVQLELISRNWRHGWGKKWGLAVGRGENLCAFY